MAKRIQSPSSINIYKQCPRRYFYQYKLKLRTKPSIHLVRGFIVHEVLEKFFEIDIDSLDPNHFEFGLKSFAQANFLKLWKANKEKLLKLRLTQDELDMYLVDSQQMIIKFVENFVKKLDEKFKTTGDLKKAFQILTPIVEKEMKSEDLMVRGFIDAIHDKEGKVVILDYKTSKKDIMTDGYKLQLGIYALLYKLENNILPDQVGINFLKFGEQLIDVDEALIEDAKKEILFIHENTDSDIITDYPKQESGLCKWSKGQCDFYDTCVKDN